MIDDELSHLGVSTSNGNRVIFGQENSDNSGPSFAGEFGKALFGVDFTFSI
jgi:hypothetical protein